MVFDVMSQGTATTPAPIPPLPPRAGAGTGATTPAGQAAQDAAAAAAQAAQDAANARDQIRRDVQRAVDQAVQTTTGEPVILQPPPYVNTNNDIPPEVIPILGMLGSFIIAIVLGFPIVRLISRVIEKKVDKSLLKAEDVNVQLRALQQSVDAMAIEIERISESQRFQSKLMAEKEPRTLASGDR